VAKSDSTLKPPKTRATSTGMSNMAFSRVGTRQLRTDILLPVPVCGA
jgi:hypothetical protein